MAKIIAVVKYHLGGKLVTVNVQKSARIVFHINTSLRKQTDAGETPCVYVKHKDKVYRCTAGDNGGYNKTVVKSKPIVKSVKTLYKPYAERKSTKATVPHTEMYASVLC